MNRANRPRARPMGKVTRIGRTMVTTSSTSSATLSPVSISVCPVVVVCAAASLIAKLASTS
ncbi:hypothetical protein D3C78_1829470 [compost metagenome]